MGNVAAQVMAWQRRARNRPGPLSPVTAPTGDSPNGAPLQVEILIDGIWTDITSRIMTRDGTVNVAITRGRPNETSAVVPGSCTFQVNNRDGQFSPRNPLSVYYGKIGRNTQVRVSVPSGNSKAYRFWGEITTWPTKWDSTGADVWVEMEAAGILRRLGQGAAPLASTLFTALTGPTTNPVVAYWPCEDAANATSIASAIPGVNPMVITGTPQLSTYTGFVCSAPLPIPGNTGNFTGTVPAYTTQVATMVRFLLAIPTTGATDGQTLCIIIASGTIQRWEVYYAAANGGQLGLRGLDSTRTTTFVDTGVGGYSVNAVPAQVSVELVQTGPDIDCSVNVLPVAADTSIGIAGIASSQTVGAVVSVVIGSGVSQTAVGHLRVQTASASPTDGFDLQQQVVAYTGENASARISRLCGAISVPSELIGTASDTVAMGPQLIATAMNLINDAQAADLGVLYESTSALGLGYRTRVSQENQTAALPLSYTAFNLSEVPGPIDDDQYTRNDITVSRTGGSSSRATQTTGAMSVLPPPAGVGQYPNAVTINVATDGVLPHQAGWRLLLGAVNEARYPTVSVNLSHSSFTSNPALRQQVLAVRPGDRLTISNPPAWLPPDLISQLVIGASETIDQFQHRITFNCVPESPYHVALLEDSVLSRIDSGGSQLAADAQPTDATLLVATTMGAVWTTNAADWPFDIRIAGEQITVTAVSGAVSPQTLTVTRSVNGVVKPLPVGADVRLNQPMITAL
ncbi:hypothetical protein ABH930_000338 [Kitasatospora sp. GAS204A]|uniref:hypothetical protein n=1 Tax=unclassified Kitasatospora TaxID=2633591 RepID=UPI002475FD8D|nr:hypothetical protein [Kitasatospora sp. GAS204B]MDH6116919.1 hypothetical protein [Kitasatospora sp. GAS204B]